MYAIFQSGGKQHRVSQGDLVQLEKLEGEVGSTLSFDQVLLAGEDGAPKIGQPMVEGASISGEITRHGRGPKIVVYKFKRRKGFHKKIGHRQPFTEVKITGIQA